MSMKLFIGGLSFSTDNESLRRGFETFGEVSEAAVVMDRDTGRSRGFGFVTFGSRTAGAAAIEGMDGHDLDGRSVRVNEAREKPPRTFGNIGGPPSDSAFGGGHSAKGKSRRSNKSDRW